VNELKTLWSRLLGETPSDQQFDLWAALHSPEVVRRGILKTTQKNLSVGGTMTADHKVRFAAKCMITASAANEDHEANRQRLDEEMKKGGAQ
jgi:hypothetical protein